MGASYSTTIPGATERQKERYGAFSLRTKQIQSLRVLNDLISELMSNENTLISLMKLIKESNSTFRQATCQDLFIVLSSSIKKEFQVLKFPDPVRPSDVMDVAFLPIKTYKDKFATEDPVRKTLCDRIAWFMTRFVTLVFALTSSLDAKRNMSLKGFSDTAFVVPELPYVAQALDFDFTKLDSYGTFENKIGSNLVWIHSDKVLIDKKQGIVFIPKTAATGVAKITISEYTPPPKPEGSTLQLAAALMGTAPQQSSGIALKTYLVTLYPCLTKSRICRGFEPSTLPTKSSVNVQTNEPAAAAPAMEAAPHIPMLQALQAAQVAQTLHTPPGGSVAASSVFNQFAPNKASVFTGTQTGGKRNTRRHQHRNRRKTYKHRRIQHGGEVYVLRFYLRQDGKTKGMDEYEFTTTFPERVEQFLNSIDETEKFKTDVNPYIPLNDTNNEVIERIRQIATAIKKEDESFSPAQYRAYLLATAALPDNKLLTSFCEDSWRHSQVSNILAYGLLHTLYKDLIGNKSSTETQNEYKSVMDQFISRNIMKPTKDYVESFYDLEFSSLPEELDALCKRHETSISNPQYKELLMNAHKSIRDLYDIHMQNVITFITSKIISPKLRGYRETPVWTLNPSFSTDSRGAPALLESLIKEARIMLAKHYYAVELIYTSTIEKIKGIGLGIAPEPSLKLE